MRNRFTELMNSGFASSKYIDHVPNVTDTSEYTPLIRMYNNVFGMPTDTRMTQTSEGDLIITGHMINTPNWSKFIWAPNWGGIQFSLSFQSQQISAKPINNLYSFLMFYGKTLEFPCVLNGDVVAKVVDMEQLSTLQPPTTPCCYTTCESQIPHKLSELTTNGDDNYIKECYQNTKNLYQVAENLNNSNFVKGNQWYVMNQSIYGNFNNIVIIL